MPLSGTPISRSFALGTVPTVDLVATQSTQSQTQFPQLSIGRQRERFAVFRSRPDQSIRARYRYNHCGKSRGKSRLLSARAITLYVEMECLEDASRPHLLSAV